MGLASRDGDRCPGRARGVPVSRRTSDQLLDLPGPVAPVVVADALAGPRGRVRRGDRCRRHERGADERRAQCAADGATSDHGVFTPAVDAGWRPGPRRPRRACRGRPAVGRGCSITSSCRGRRCDLATSPVVPVPAPPRAAASAATGRGGRDGRAGGGSERASRRVRVRPLRPYLAPLTDGNPVEADGVTTGHARAPRRPPAERRVRWPHASKVLLAAPRGYCAGVERAVEAVERALEAHGTPVYVRKQIVHNAHVVADLETKGAVFVDEETEVPEGHGRRPVGPRGCARGL